MSEKLQVKGIDESSAAFAKGLQESIANALNLAVAQASGEVSKLSPQLAALEQKQVAAIQNLAEQIGQMKNLITDLQNSTKTELAAIQAKIAKADQMRERLRGLLTQLAAAFTSEAK